MASSCDDSLTPATLGITPSTSSQTLPAPERLLSNSKRAVAAREKRAKAALQKGNQPGQWGGARARAKTTTDACTQTDEDEPQATAAISTQTDDGLPQDQDVERLKLLQQLEQQRFERREYECELEEGRERVLSEEPGWEPGLTASLALNIDRLNYDVLELRQAVRDLGNVVREADSAAMPEVTHELLRQLEACALSSIRLSADPRKLCARIGMPEELYSQLMLMNQPMRVDRLRQQIIDYNDTNELHPLDGGFPGAETFAAMLVHDAEALAGFTGLTIDDLAPFSELSYDEALACAFEKRRDAQQRFMVTWSNADWSNFDQVPVGRWACPTNGFHDCSFLARCKSVHAAALQMAQRECERQIELSAIRGENVSSLAAAMDTG